MAVVALPLISDQTTPKSSASARPGKPSTAWGQPENYGLTVGHRLPLLLSAGADANVQSSFVVSTRAEDRVRTSSSSCRF